MLQSGISGTVTEMAISSRPTITLLHTTGISGTSIVIALLIRIPTHSHRLTSRDDVPGAEVIDVELLLCATNGLIFVNEIGTNSDLNLNRNRNDYLPETVAHGSLQKLYAAQEVKIAHKTKSTKKNVSAQHQCITTLPLLPLPQATDMMALAHPNTSHNLKMNTFHFAFPSECYARVEL